MSLKTPALIVASGPIAATVVNDPNSGSKLARVTPSGSAVPLSNGTQSGDLAAFPALTAIHYVHRLMAFVVLGAMVWLGWRLWRVPGMGRTARALLLLAMWQFASGLTNVVLDWPLLAAVGHTAGAAALVIVFTGALSGTRSASTRRAQTPGTSSLNMSRSMP